MRLSLSKSFSFSPLKHPNIVFTSAQKACLIKDRVEILRQNRLSIAIGCFKVQHNFSLTKQAP